MPNIKSAKKRVLVNNKKTELNKNIKSAVKTAIKKVELLIKDNNLDQAKIALSDAFSAIDSAANKNIFHKSNAANKKARLAKKLDAALKLSPVSEEKKEAKKEVATPKVEEVAPVATPEVVEVKEVKKAPAKKATATKTAAKKTTTRKTAAKKIEE